MPSASILDRLSYLPEQPRLTVVDAHTAGEPLRVIIGGFPELSGRTMLERRRQASRHHDRLRRLLMWEPRGHADMYGCILTAAPTSDGDVGVLFVHNEGFSTMCGHGIIGLVKVGLEFELFRPADPNAIQIDTPAGRVVARAESRKGRVASVSFLNVPSFLLESGLIVQVPETGEVRCDIAFGGAFYAYVEAADAGLDLTPANHSRIIEAGRRIKQAVTEQYAIRHPKRESELDFLYGTIFVQPGSGDAHSRHVCVFADGEVDRSPTGTGVSGRAAILHSGGQLETGRPILIESILGTCFGVEVVRETDVKGHPAVIPRVTGSAHVTGCAEFVLDPEDPLREGFLLR